MERENQIQMFNTNILVKFFVGIVLAILAVSVATVVYGEHAVERHGSTAEEVRNCMEQKGPVLKMYNPETKRDANICQIAETLFGVMITEVEEDGKIKEVTSFEKEKLKTLEKIIRYLENAGYKQ